MNDPTEPIRREMCAIINSNPQPRSVIEAHFGQAWDTSELVTDFDALAFRAPLVIVRRKSDEKLGSLFFQHGPPRLYWGWSTKLPDGTERKGWCHQSTINQGQT